MSSLLSTINSPADLRALSVPQLNALAEEIRARMIEVVSTNGGHLASSLGVVELTLALHRVFDFSRDYLVLDVGHQCYPHKLITGRRESFSTLRQHGGLSGFPNFLESPYDLFISGHSSTSISAAAGLAAAAKLRGEKRQAVALIGDGAMTGGMCFEAMNHAGNSGLDLLVVLNDNEMAISKTVGAFSQSLEEFRSRPKTTAARNLLRRLVRGIPLLGGPLSRMQEHFFNILKNHHGAASVFEALGFRYFGPFDGHDIAGMLNEFSNLKQLSGPRIVHLITEKGRGMAAAAADPETFHSAAPFSMPSVGKITLHAVGRQTYTQVFADTLVRIAAADDKVVGVTAAMVTGTGMKRFAEKFPERFYDVGIAEEHAVTFAAGLAKAGFVPVVAIYSTFLQRAYDQVFHDLALQRDLPVVLAVDRAGLVGSDGQTHHGVFDISYLRHLPGLVLLAPRDAVELREMLKFAVALRRTVAIRYPRGGVPEEDALPPGRTPLALGKAEKLRDGSDGAILAYGRMVAPVYAAAVRLENSYGKKFAVWNARFCKPLDAEMLADAARAGKIVTVENNALAGGFGSAVAEKLSDLRINCPLQRLGIPDEFVGAGTVAELDAELGLDVDGIVRACLEA